MNPVALESAVSALGLGSREHVSLVGGGGKTTLWHEIGNGLGGPVIMTTTTKMGTDQHRGIPVLIAPDDTQVCEAFVSTERVIVWRDADGTKALGVTPERADTLFGLAMNMATEADGARRHPFKAPANFEPVVPSSTTVMVSVIGADALGRVIADRCHRPLRVAALAECDPYERLTPRHAAAVLLHERGALKEKPAGARFAVAITKVGPDNWDYSTELVEEIGLLSPTTRVAVFADRFV
ncbi:MAG: putative selenium-dependent hydroxylase accessory protein YqeC [Actinomycetia bacterium]|nr:putative selenium-dependent hydroxylase accessory protein YqeC [Actinomycetes bacterium]MCP4961785.1 putative selenium-dependent hydroxylase accessory protein YqeC [Actinomycetes bacterium]